MSGSDPVNEEQLDTLVYAIAQATKKVHTRGLENWRHIKVLYAATLIQTIWITILYAT